MTNWWRNFRKINVQKDKLKESENISKAFSIADVKDKEYRNDCKNTVIYIDFTENLLINN